VNCGPRSNFLYIVTPFYFYSHYLLYLLYYCFPLDMLIPLFTANRWDWEPHSKLGAKYWVVLCAGSMLLLVQSKALDEAPYKLSGAVAKLAGITFWCLTFSYWFNKPWFLTEGKLAAVLIIPPLVVPNWSVIYINTAPQSIPNGCSDDIWCGQIATQLGTPRGRYDEHSSKFSLSKKPRFIEPVGKSQTS
jgi:hypothetical protein